MVIRLMVIVLNDCQLTFKIEANAGLQSSYTYHVIPMDAIVKIQFDYLKIKIYSIQLVSFMNFSNARTTKFTE